jgi:predicted acetyltransferase
MSVSLRDAKGSAADRQWIQAAFPEYLQELARVSATGTGVFPVLGEHGARDGELLARWFRDDRSHPVLILDGGRAAGFALVSRPLVTGAAKAAPEFRMAEFFIEPRSRRRGVGRAAAVLLFSRFAGQWEVAESTANADAVSFWRDVITDYTHGRYQERVRDGEVRQNFRSGNSPGPARS